MTNAVAAFPLTASFYLPSEDAPNLSVEAVAEAILAHYPSATIDWKQGRQKMVDELQRLIDMGCPEIIYRGHKSLLDKTIFVQIAVDGTESFLSGYTSGFYVLDGCIALECEPFDIDAIKVGTERFAHDLKLGFDLSAGGVGDLHLKIVPRALEAHEFATEHFPGERFRNPIVTRLENWKTPLTSACEDWLRYHPEPNVVQKWSAIFLSGNELAESLIARIDSVGPIHAASRVYFGDGNWHSCMVFEYSRWTAILVLPGVPRPLLG